MSAQGFRFKGGMDACTEGIWVWPATQAVRAQSSVSCFGALACDRVTEVRAFLATAERPGGCSPSDGHTGSLRFPEHPSERD